MSLLGRDPPTLPMSPIFYNDRRPHSQPRLHPSYKLTGLQIRVSHSKNIDGAILPRLRHVIQTCSLGLFLLRRA